MAMGEGSQRLAATEAQMGGSLSRVPATTLHAWIMSAKGVCNLGVPFGVVALYALLCSLQNLWHVATEKLITPPTVLRL